jgi:hypothetical protein
MMVRGLIRRVYHRRNLRHSSTLLLDDTGYVFLGAASRWPPRIGANLRPELDHRLMHLRLEVFLQNHFAVGQDLLNVRVIPEFADR